ncbi:MAG: hypothetical protein PF439_01680 [Helicobacteraceae bacterium]|jgi:hypothetical protein|nr:hypothetical protein [Helicobacteraceae bacterium]
MKPSSYDIPLHDIKPLMEVPDSSLMLLTVISAVVIMVLSGALFLLYRFMKDRKTVNLRKEHYKILNEVNFRDPKKAAYDITEYGRLFSVDSERLNSAYANLVSRLEPYKYKRVVDAIDEESLGYFKIYLGMIDV